MTHLEAVRLARSRKAAEAGHGKPWWQSAISSLSTREILTHALPDFLQQQNYNLVGAAINAGAGHLTQIERQLAMLRQLGLDDRISMVELDPQSGPVRDMGDLATKLYPLLQKNPHIFHLVNQLFQTEWAEPLIDKNILAMMKHSTAFEEKLNQSAHFDPKQPTIFMSTHVVTSMASIATMQKRKNVRDILLEYIPDPWVDADLRAMSAASEVSNGMRHIVLVHDQATVDEYHKIHPDSQALVLPLGTLSAERYQHPEKRKRPIDPEAPIDVLIQCSGNPVPGFDAQVEQFIRTNAVHIASGEMRVVIDPMHHTMHKGKKKRSSYETYMEALKSTGLATEWTRFDEDGYPIHGVTMSENVLLLQPDHNLRDAIISREAVINGEDKEVKSHFGEREFSPTLVVAKGGEKPIEDWGDSVMVFCPMISAPHEEKDILQGVAEGRAVDGRGIPESQWFNQFREIHRQLLEGEVAASPESTAHLAPIIALQDELVKYVEQKPKDSINVFGLILGLVWWMAHGYPKELVPAKKKSKD